MNGLPRWRLRYSLRSLFVLFTVCGALSWVLSQAIVVHRRNEFRRHVVWSGQFDYQTFPMTTIPFLRRLLGDELVLRIDLANEDQRDEACRLFPEAVWIWVSPGPTFSLKEARRKANANESSEIDANGVD